MSIRIGALAVASPIFFLAISAIAFSTSSNAGEYRAAAVAVPRPVARPEQQSPPTQPTPPRRSGNNPEAKGGNPSRWEGIVERSSSKESTLDVRRRSNNLMKTIYYDSSTKWVSQHHGSKKVNDIDASQVKDGDRVICIGIYDEKGKFRAVYISKRN